MYKYKLINKKESSGTEKLAAFTVTKLDASVATAGKIAADAITTIKLGRK